MEAVAWSALNPHDKHVDVLLRSSALCREIGAITNIVCDSGEYYQVLLSLLLLVIHQDFS